MFIPLRSSKTGSKHLQKKQFLIFLFYRVKCKEKRIPNEPIYMLIQKLVKIIENIKINQIPSQLERQPFPICPQHPVL